MTPLSPARLLAVWESGARRHPIDRAVLLHALAEPQLAPDTVADQPLGRRNAAILALREACFDGPLAAWVDCPDCGERMSFEVDTAALPPRPDGPADPLRLGPLTLALPTSRHLAQTLAHTDPDAAAQALLRVCLEEAGAADAATLDEWIDAAGEAIDAADPWADLALSLSCPACQAPVEASFDIADYVWDELGGHAQALLDEIHQLAMAYGWSEGQILALSDTRRAAYLARVGP